MQNGFHRTNCLRPLQSTQCTNRPAGYQILAHQVNHDTHRTGKNLSDQAALPVRLPAKNGQIRHRRTEQRNALYRRTSKLYLREKHRYFRQSRLSQNHMHTRKSAGTTTVRRLLHMVPSQPHNQKEKRIFRPSKHHPARIHPSTPLETPGRIRPRIKP